MRSGADSREVPGWVVRMREARYDVLRGTGDLPDVPEVAFSIPDTPEPDGIATAARDQASHRVPEPVEFVRTTAYLPGELQPGSKPMAASSVIHSDPEILGGTPVFVGTRVPLKNLIDYLEGGHPLDDFLDDFPTVTREQVLSVLDEAQEALSQRARAA